MNPIITLSNSSHQNLTSDVLTEVTLSTVDVNAGRGLLVVAGNFIKCQYSGFARVSGYATGAVASGGSIWRMGYSTNDVADNYHVAWCYVGSGPTEVAGGFSVVVPVVSGGSFGMFAWLKGTTCQVYGNGETNRAKLTVEALL